MTIYREPTFDDSIIFLRKWVVANLRKPMGVHCKGCGQRAKAYKRKIYAVPAHDLITLYRLTEKTRKKWHHINDFVTKNSGGSFALTQHWGLAKEKANKNTDKKNSGYWRLTKEGIFFVNDLTRIPKYKWIYNNVVQNTEGPHVSIRQCLNKKFNYKALMQNEW